MDEAELKTEEVAHATREFGWFAIALLCIMALLVINLHA